MFQGASSANPDVSEWDVSQVTDMGYMFYDASLANPDVSEWDVSQVTNMGYMFQGASSANPDVSEWDVSQVTDMGYMFYDASSAHPEVSGWDVSQVTSMRYMFQGVSLANPDMSMWDFNSVIDMSGMFKNVVLSIRNYTAMLNRIHQTSEQSNVVLGGGNSKYSHRAQEAREMLEARGWIIDDGGKTEVSIPKVTSVAIISTPRVGNTYGRDEYIEVSVTFSEVVKLSGGLKLLSLFIGELEGKPDILKAVAVKS